MNNKTLFLPLKAKWYELIEKGIKTEEYREINPHWAKRITTIRYKTDILYTLARYQLIDEIKENFSFKDFKRVRFSYGYTNRTMEFKCDGIEIGKGNKDWGAPEEEVFIIKLGSRIYETQI